MATLISFAGVYCILFWELPVKSQKAIGRKFVTCIDIKLLKFRRNNCREKSRLITFLQLRENCFGTILHWLAEPKGGFLFLSRNSDKEDESVT